MDLEGLVHILCAFMEKKSDSFPPKVSVHLAGLPHAMVVYIPKPQIPADISF